MGLTKTRSTNRKNKRIGASRNRKSGKVSRRPTSKRRMWGPLLLVCFGALGVWQCIDGRTPDAEPSSDPMAVSHVDVGEGKEADPTVVHEETLAPEKMGETSPRDLVVADEVDSDDLSIADAGDVRDSDVDTEELTRFPMYAVAYHFHTQIRESPDMEARVVSYARRGATFRVGERVSTTGCRRGWHEVQGGGFICDGVGFQVATHPVTWDSAPPSPAINRGLPYDYKYTRRDEVVGYWKPPSAEEVERAAAVLKRVARREARGDEAKKPDGNEADTSGAQEDGVSRDYDDAALTEVLRRAAEAENDNDTVGVKDISAKGSGSVVSSVVQTDSAGSAVAFDARDADSDTSSDDPYVLPDYVHMSMKKGFYVSVVGAEEAEGVTYLKTVRGRYLPKGELYPVKASTLEGALLNDGTDLPLGIIVGDNVRTLKKKSDNGPFSVYRNVPKYERFKVLGKVTRGTATYIRIGTDEYVNYRRIAVARPAVVPSDVSEQERWIAIDLSEQTLVAYEGQIPVFATVVSTGKNGFATPEGEFRIYNKHVSINMSDLDAEDESFYIEDVPWTQFFKAGYALHAAFWHDRFGHVRSHGCINLSPLDARRLFFWTGPHLPGSRHGIIATSDNPGTRIVIYSSENQP